MFRLERQPYSDDLERVGEEDGSDASHTSRYQPAEGCLLIPRWDHRCSDLLIGKKLDGGIGEDSEQSGRMTLEEAAETLMAVDIPHGRRNAKPTACILCELWIGGLEEDLDAVEGSDDRFGLGYDQHVLPFH